MNYIKHPTNTRKNEKLGKLVDGRVQSLAFELSVLKCRIQFQDHSLGYNVLNCCC
jgi:hypothetical protein